MDDSHLRQERIAKARTILTHREFLAKSPVEQEAVLQRLTAKGLDPADLADLQRELNPTFALLDKNPIVQILGNMSPKDVLNSCQVNVQFRKICSDQRVFVYLMRKHYPHYDLTDDPKKQYTNITRGIGTTYFSWIQSNGNEVTDTNGRQIELLDGYLDEVYQMDKTHPSNWHNYVEFKVLGAPPRDGTVLWLQMRSWNTVTAKVFFSKEEAVQDFIQKEYRRLLGDLIEDYDALDLLGEPPEFSIERESVKRFLDERWLPRNFTPQGIYEYVMANGFYHENPTIEDISQVIIWQFVPTTIRNRVYTP